VFNFVLFEVSHVFFREKSQRASKESMLIRYTQIFARFSEILPKLNTSWATLFQLRLNSVSSYAALTMNHFGLNEDLECSGSYIFPTYWHSRPLFCHLRLQLGLKDDLKAKMTLCITYK